jgi:hypothetical protein
LLPRGFKYPARLSVFADADEAAAVAPWWFVDATSEAGALFWSVRTSDGRNLIPFAKVDDGRGDIACFDGGDLSGDPAVHMLVLDGSGRRYEFANFDAWLDSALRDAGKRGA